MFFRLFREAGSYIPTIGAVFSFFATIFLLKAFANKLPCDQGRAFAVEGTLSKGKVRGAGIIFIMVFSAAVLLFDILRPEKAVYISVIICSMLTGFFDDASEKPWNEYLKGALDLLLAAVVAITYLKYNGNRFMVLPSPWRFDVTIPYWLAFILIMVLVWVSINVTNCTDGVDGLSATLSMITLGAFMSVLELCGYTEGILPVFYFIVVLAAYLWYNANPSTMLMGDAGSRAMGMMIAVTALMSGYPFLYIPFAIVMILDGGLGLLKVALLRFLKIRILKDIRCPLHDHARKAKGWSNTQVVFRFAIIQFMFVIPFVWMFRMI